MDADTGFGGDLAPSRSDRYDVVTSDPRWRSAVRFRAWASMSDPKIVLKNMADDDATMAKDAIEQEATA
jgi:hypothetical protein